MDDRPWRSRQDRTRLTGRLVRPVPTALPPRRSAVDADRVRLEVGIALVGRDDQRRGPAGAALVDARFGDVGPLRVAQAGERIAVVGSAADGDLTGRAVHIDELLSAGVDGDVLGDHVVPAGPGWSAGTCRALRAG